MEAILIRELAPIIYFYFSIAFTLIKNYLISMINLTDYQELEKIIKAGDVVLKSPETTSLKTQILRIQVAVADMQRELSKRPGFYKRK
jgi:hypothetical protein